MTDPKVNNGTPLAKPGGVEHIYNLFLAKNPELAKVGLDKFSQDIQNPKAFSAIYAKLMERNPQLMVSQEKMYMDLFGKEMQPYNADAELTRIANRAPEPEGPNFFQKLGSVITNDIPGAASSAVSSLEGINREYKQNKLGGGVNKPERATLLNGDLESMQSYWNRLDQWTKYNKENAGEIARSKELQVELLKYAQKQKLEAAQDMKGSIQRLDQIHSFTDAMDWLGTATSQAVGHIPASALTFGASSVLMETGEIYLSAVEKIAEDKSMELGRPVTIEEVIKNGWDEPASAWTYGVVAGSLDYLGAKGVTGSFSRNQAMKEIQKRGMDILLSSAYEGGTEAAQSIIEQVGAFRGANQTWSDAFSSIDPMDVIESAAQGFVGGGAISTVGNIKGAVTAKREGGVKAPEGDLGKRSEQLQQDKDQQQNLATGATLAKEEAQIDQAIDEVAPLDPNTAALVDANIEPIVEEKDDDLDLLATELAASQQEAEAQKEIDQTAEREKSIDELENQIADLKSKLTSSNKEDAVKVRKELKEVRRQHSEAVAENDRLNYESDKAEFESNFTSEELDQMSNEDEFNSQPRNDSEDQGGIPSPERGPEAPVQAGPEPGRSQAPTEPSGMVQEKQEERSVKRTEIERKKAPGAKTAEERRAEIKAQNEAVEAKRKAKITPKKSELPKENLKEEIEDESDLGPAEPLYQPKKKVTPKKEAKKISKDPLTDLEKEVTTNREKGKINTLKEYRNSIDEFEKNPTFEGLNQLKETQKSVKEALSKGKTDTYDIEITREQKKLDGRLASLQASTAVKEAVREGKKAASSAQREVTKARSGVEKAYKEIVKLRDEAQKKAIKATEKRLGGKISEGSTASIPFAKEDQNKIDRWTKAAEDAAKKYEEMSGKKLTKKEKENLTRWGTFESEEDRIKRELEKDIENLQDESFTEDEPLYKKATSLKAKITKLDQKFGDSFIAEASQPDSVRHGTAGFGLALGDGSYHRGAKMIQYLKYISAEALERLANITESATGRASYVQDFYRAFTTANKLRAQVGLPPVKLFIAPGTLHVDRGNSIGGEVRGLYMPGQAASIVISEDAFNDRTTALHESIHPITSLFGAIADLKLPENKAYNKFKKDLGDIYVNAKVKVEEAIEDIIAGKDVDSGLHVAILQHFETTTPKEFKELLANNSDKLRGRNPSVWIYGLTNPSEMASEAFSNPGFANILLNIKDPKAKNTENKKSIFYKIAKNIVDYLTELYEQVFNTKDTSYQRLLDLVSDFEQAFTDGEIVYDGLSEAIIRKEDVIEFAKASPLSKTLPKKVVDKLVDGAIDKGIESIKDFKKYLAEFNIRLQNKRGEPLNASQVKQLVAEFRERSKIDNLIAEAKAEVEANVYTSDRYLTSPTFQDTVDQFMEIQEVDKKDKRKYYVALSALAEGAITPELAQIHSRYTAKARTAEVVATKGFGYRELSTNAAHYKNPAQLVTQMAKSVTKHADKLMETFYVNVMKYHARASIATKKQLQDLMTIVNEEKLTRPDYIRAAVYGLIARTEIAPDPRNPMYVAEIKANIDYLKSTQKEKALAVAKKNEKRWDKAYIESENEIIEEFERKLFTQQVPLGELLTPGQRRLYDAFRGQLEGLKLDVMENTNAYWGHKNKTFWQDEHNYFPSRVMGRNEVAELNDAAQAFTDVLMNEDGDYGQISPLQSRFTKKYNQAKKVYLDLNLLSVAEAYLGTTNYDLYATKEVRVLNSLLRNTETANTIGPKNVSIIRDSIAAHIKAATGRNYNFGTLVRGLESVKDKLIVAKLGTTGQWLTQLVGQLPAIAGFTSPAHLAKASSILTDFSKRYGMGFDAWLEKNAAGLQIRDLYFETEQAVAKTAKLKDPKRLSAKVEKFADTTTRWALKQSDRLAARLAFISAFLEAGGDFENPSKEALAHAERKTILSQNVSDIAFAPGLFRPESAIARVMLSATMPFKSFALQQMLNTYAAARDFNNSTEAKKMFTANALSTIGYTASQYVLANWVYHGLTSGAMATIQATVFDAIGMEAWAEALRSRDDDDEEKNYSFFEGLVVNSFMDMFFSGLPTFAEKWIDNFYNENIAAPRIEAKTGKKFDPYLDSPLIVPKDAYSYFGSYQEIARFGDTVIGGAARWTTTELLEVFSDNYTKKETSEIPISAVYRLIMIDAMSMLPFVPFRGDIAKLDRDLVRELKEQEREQGKAGMSKPSLRKESARRPLRR